LNRILFVVGRRGGGEKKEKVLGAGDVPIGQTIVSCS